MTRFAKIDLSKLPAPAVIETPDFATLLAEMKARAVELMPALADVLELESEPATQVLRVCAYFRMLDRLEFNDGVRATQLAHATGTDLDHLAAFWGVARLTIQEADAEAVPPVPEVLESDEDLRLRTQLSLEAHTSAGSVGAYLFHALSAHADVKDASVVSPTPGDVIVSVLSRQGDGTPAQAVLDAVTAALTPEDVRPLTDFPVVEAPEIVTFTVEAELTLYAGPDPAAVEAAVDAALAAYLDQHHALGRDITRAGLFAALMQPGVQNVALTQPAADIVIGPGQAAWCTADAISIGGVAT